MRGSVSGSGRRRGWRAPGACFGVTMRSSSASMAAASGDGRDPELLYRRGGGCSELPLHYRDRSLRSRPLPGKTQLQRLELLGIELKVRLLVRSPDKALPVGKSSTPDGAAHYRTPQ